MTYPEIIESNQSLDVAVPRETTYLTKEEAGKGTVARIKQFERHELEGEHGTEHKTVLTFSDLAKGLVLNQTNKEALREYFGPLIKDCINQWVVLYNDPNVSFGGKRVGGIRLREASKEEG